MEEEIDKLLIAASHGTGWDSLLLPACCLSCTPARCRRPWLLYNDVCPSSSLFFKIPCMPAKVVLPACHVCSPKLPRHKNSHAAAEMSNRLAFVKRNAEAEQMRIEQKAAAECGSGSQPSDVPENAEVRNATAATI